MLNISPALIGAELSYKKRSYQFFKMTEKSAVEKVRKIQVKLFWTPFTQIKRNVDFRLTFYLKV